jgi:DNA polymerase III gamma/tau subunit
VAFDKESLEYIAKVSKWAMRNAISLFEQMIEDEEVSYAQIVEKLWLTDSDTITWVYNKLLDWDVEVLNIIHTLTKDGKNLNVFFWEILSYAKEQVLQNLKSDDISTRVYILDVLNTWLSSLKYSYDPEVTVMTILSKILGIYKVVIPTIERKISVWSIAEDNSITSHVVIDTQHSRSVEPVTEKTPGIKLDNIKLQDATDIFWGSPEKKEENTATKAQFDNFSKDAFLDALRSIGTKWALIISLKQARNFSMHENHLEIVLQNNFTLKAMNTWENVLQLIKWLEKMWVEWKTVKLN